MTPTLQSAVDDLKMQAIGESAELAASFARSAAEAAYRGESRILELYLTQLRIVAIDAINTYKTLGRMDKAA